MSERDELEALRKQIAEQAAKLREDIKTLEELLLLVLGEGAAPDEAEE